MGSKTRRLCALGELQKSGPPIDRKTEVIAWPESSRHAGEQRRHEFAILSCSLESQS